MKNKKIDEISRKELENERQMMKDASVVDEITVNIPVEGQAAKVSTKRKPGRPRKQVEAKESKEKREKDVKIETETNKIDEKDNASEENSEKVSQDTIVYDAKLLRRKRNELNQVKVDESETEEDENLSFSSVVKGTISKVLNIEVLFVAAYSVSYITFKFQSLIYVPLFYMIISFTIIDKDCFKRNNTKKHNLLINSCGINLLIYCI